jgi:SAM-dependent methyltransferase
MDFDQHAETYLTAVDQAAGVSVERLAGEKARIILKVLAGCIGDPGQLRVLDIGCGIGLIDQELDGGVAELCGVDTSLRLLELARARAPGACFVHYDGVRLPFLDSSFDVVFASCVLHHVPAARVAASWRKRCGRCGPRAQLFAVRLKRASRTEPIVR